jgi:hypothetical protein
MTVMMGDDDDDDDDDGKDDDDGNDVDDVDDDDDDDADDDDDHNEDDFGGRAVIALLVVMVDDDDPISLRNTSFIPDHPFRWDGFMTFVLSDDVRARLLRQHFVFKVQRTGIQCQLPVVTRAQGGPLPQPRRRRAGPLQGGHRGQ